MRVAITGATGYLGSNLTQTLLNRGDSVVVLTRSPTNLRRLNPARDRLEIHSYDALGMHAAVTSAPIDAVVHAAVCYGRQGEGADFLIDANVRVPVSVALAAGTRIGRWLSIGSALPNRVSPYALSKSQFAAWLSSLPASALAPRFHLAFQHFYGPGDDPGKFTTHVVRSCLASGELHLTAGTQRRDFLYVDDAVSAVLAVLDNAEPTDLYTDIQVGTGMAVPVRQFVELTHAFAISKTVLRFGALPTRPNEPDLCVADISALDQLGWRPQNTLERGIALTVAGERALAKMEET